MPMRTMRIMRMHAHNQCACACARRPVEIDLARQVAQATIESHKPSSRLPLVVATAPIHHPSSMRTTHTTSHITTYDIYILFSFS